MKCTCFKHKKKCNQKYCICVTHDKTCPKSISIELICNCIKHMKECIVKNK